MGLLESRLVRRLRPGIGQILAQKRPYRGAWLDENRRALEASGPLWVALGDSTAQGVGASAYDRGYVGELRRLLEQRDGHQWRVLNASVTGARVRDVLSEQLPWLDGLSAPPHIVTCAVGANDLLRPGLKRLMRDMATLLTRLPSGALVATLPQGLGTARARRVNAFITVEAPRHGLVIADVWRHTGPPWTDKLSADGFHPSDVGYRDWTAAFAEALGISFLGS